MGIKYLNSFLKENCPKSIKCISMSDLSGKKIAIDISIYLYKYASENCLIENIYLMISIFRHYNITPIFIFDGKPPAEKKELLQCRRDAKKDAENEYNRLKGCLAESITEIDKQEIIANMDVLKKQIVYITKNQINKVKELIVSAGVTYYDALGEADELCAMLAIKERVWACLSEDMDMFVYGCPRVLRYFSLLNHTAVLYCMENILQELKLTQKEFRQLCVLSGTDYNISNNDSNNDSNNNYNNGPNLHKTIKLFKKYKQFNDSSCDFYEWIQKNDETYINNVTLLNNTYSIFELSENHVHLNIYDKIHIENSKILNQQLRPILEEDGFMFPV